MVNDRSIYLIKIVNVPIPSFRKKINSKFIPHFRTEEQCDLKDLSVY